MGRDITKGSIRNQNKDDLILLLIHFILILNRLLETELTSYSIINFWDVLQGLIHVRHISPEF